MTDTPQSGGEAAAKDCNEISVSGLSSDEGKKLLSPNDSFAPYTDDLSTIGLAHILKQNSLVTGRSVIRLQTRSILSRTPLFRCDPALS
ncbi:hypothetical protein BHE74_00052217 [Ensete ventricosum]|nr:hypothetical protein BHE74_00052217 [Ensete ventricosum]